MSRAVMASGTALDGRTSRRPQSEQWSVGLESVTTSGMAQMIDTDTTTQPWNIELYLTSHGVFV